jgi:drug/metabolite transporter (DMT)-like permease
VWSRALPAPRSPFMAAAAQSWVGGLVLVAASLALGEWHHGMFAHATWRGLSAMLYLIVFGSFLGYGSFIFLLRHVQPTVVATYAFVNPLIAVLLGCLFQESFTLQIAEAGALIVAAVALVIFAGRAAKAGPGRGGTTAITRPPSSARVGRTTTRSR